MKDKFIKFLLVFILAGVAINLSLLGINEAVIHPEIEKKATSCFPSQSYNPPSVISNVTANYRTSSPLAFLFQIMFILFFISPPIIAFMLFLIWKELKERNRMK